MAGIVLGQHRRCVVCHIANHVRLPSAVLLLRWDISAMYDTPDTAEDGSAMTVTKYRLAASVGAGHTLKHMNGNTYAVLWGAMRHDVDEALDRRCRTSMMQSASSSLTMFCAGVFTAPKSRRAQTSTGYTGLSAHARRHAGVRRRGLHHVRREARSNAAEQRD